jgi:hypothetical protein
MDANGSDSIGLSVLLNVKENFTRDHLAIPSLVSTCLQEVFHSVADAMSKLSWFDTPNFGCDHRE